jgi:hypothetical protein
MTNDYIKNVKFHKNEHYSDFHLMSLESFENE